MKKKILFLLLSILACGAISATVETLFFNSKPIFSSDNSISEVTYNTRKKDDKTEIKIDVENQYIRQLLIEYETPEDVDYSINYTFKGAYDRDTNESFDDIFENTFTASATNINAEVSQLSITYNNENSSKLQISKIIIDNAFHFNHFRAFFIFLSLFSICLLFAFYKDGFTTDKIHIYFAITCSILGLMIIVAQPAMNFFCWDDQTHFDRVVNLPFDSTSFNTGEFNMSDAGTINHNWHESTDSFTENRIHSNFLDLGNSTTYTGNNAGTFLAIHRIPYLPMTIGYHLAKLVGLPFIVCFEVGKIFNLLFYVLLMAYAIKILQSGKRLLTIIALLPSNIFLASSYSYDPAVITGITIFLVHIINLLIDNKHTQKFTFKTAIILILSMTYACLAKAVYAPLMLLTLLIPKEKFKSAKQCRLTRIGFVVITILLGGTLLLSSLDGVNPSDSRGGEVSVKDQAALVLSHPFDYASVLNDTAVSDFGYKLFSPNTLTNFSYTHTFSNRDNIYYVFIFLLIFIFLTDNKKNQLNKKQRLWILIDSLLIILLIWSALYVDFTPVGSTTINGVQNRYFLPLLLPLLFCLQFPNIQNKINPKYYNLAIFTLTVISMIFMVYQSILFPYNF